MNQKEKASAMEQFKNITAKVKVGDIAKVSKKIGDMNKGALEKVWDKVSQLWAMVKDNDAPWQSKAIALAALVYAITPIDAIPDLIPVLGLTDDVSVILAAVASLSISLMKYSKTDKLLESTTALSRKKALDYETTIQQIKIIVSTLSLTASCDGETSPEEEKRCLELINYFVFSDEGYVSDKFFKKNKIKKKNINKVIQESFDNPASLDEIAQVADSMESEETLYYYAFSIASVDNQINELERVFLDNLAEKLEIQTLEKTSIERRFNEEWLDGFKPSLD